MRERFLEALRKVPNVTSAADEIGTRRDSMYQIREVDAEFAEAWDNAVKEGVDRMARELHRRGYEGVEKPVYYQGVRCGTIREFSDGLAMFLIKAHDDRFREHTTIDHNVNDVTQTILDARKRAGK